MGVDMGFSDVSPEGVEVKSYDAKEHEQKYVRDCLVQTDPRVFASRSTQIIKRKQIQVQTEDQSREFDPDRVPLHHPKLEKFLSSVEEMVFEALEENLTTDSFAGYDVDWSEDQEDEVSCLHDFLGIEALLNAVKSDGASNTNESLRNTEHSSLQTDSAKVASLSWNCTGNLFAAALSQVQHEDWCVHKCVIVLWNISRGKLDSKKPHNCIECSGCITTVCFHPKNPALLAAGSFNGEVFIYDLSKEESSQLVVNVASLHTEPISSVAWVKDPESNAMNAPYMLVTAGQDGKVLLSSLNELSKQLTLMSGQVLLAESMSGSVLGVSSAVLGVSVLASFALDQSSFVLGSETGGLFKCSFVHSTHSRIVHSITQQDVQFSSAAQLSLDPHLGPVTYVSTCPFHWKILLTASSDATVRIYNVLQFEPCLTLKVGEPVCAVDWSPVRPMVFAAVTAANNLLFFDLAVSRSAPVKTVSIHSKSRSSAFSASVVKFNAQRNDLIATGDSSGHIKLWVLSTQLVKGNDPNELASLEKLCSVSEINK